ncbi:MAG: UDP-N-acetylmuramate dehydrogenase [Anaerovoracaceae bacterium]
MNTEQVYRDLSGLVRDENCIVRDALMKNYTTFRIGGPADLLIQPSSEEELIRIAAYLRQKDISAVVLGNGSNVLVKDGGIRGVVIKIGKNMGNIRTEGEELTAEAGALLSAAALAAADGGLTGMEFAAGIPGSVGGAVFMNAGAYGGEMSQIIVSCRALMPDGALREFSKEELKLGYRTSVFSQNGGIVTSCRIKLQAGDRETIYGYMRELAGRRTEKQPLNLPSAGSTFKRPEGYFAGKLIQDSGCRGLRVGGARISQKHAGFVVNEADASAEDVIRLIRLVQMRVRDCFGVDLEPEVRIIGEN